MPDDNDENPRRRTYSFPHDFGEGPPRWIGPYGVREPVNLIDFARLYVDEQVERAPGGGMEGPIHIPRIGGFTARSIAEDEELSDAELARRALFGRPVIQFEPSPEASNFARFLRVRVAERRMADIQRTIGEQLGRAMAERMDRMILAFYLPVFSTEEEMQAWFASFGIEAPDGLPLPLGLYAQRGMMERAKTLRQRCFARACSVRGNDHAELKISLVSTDVKAHVVRPLRKGLASLMAACRRDPVTRKALANMPISNKPYRTSGNDEVVSPLQDLADIVAQEARAAYEQDYYPGVADVDPLTDEHVEQVMVAMQREIDREQRVSRVEDRNMRTAHLPDLPIERKRALAERRRHWFGVFGITPKRWKRGTWSMWNVQNIPYPEGFKKLRG